MKPDDLQKRHEEVQIAQDAKALRENPLVEAWKEEEKNKVLDLLMNAAPGAAGDGEREAAQSRLLALNDLAASLRTKIQTGSMAEKQISDHKQRQERKRALQEVVNG